MKKISLFTLLFCGLVMLYGQSDKSSGVIVARQNFT